MLGTLCAAAPVMALSVSLEHATRTTSHTGAHVHCNTHVEGHTHFLAHTYTYTAIKIYTHAVSACAHVRTHV